MLKFILFLCFFQIFQDFDLDAKLFFTFIICKFIFFVFIKNFQGRDEAISFDSLTYFKQNIGRVILFFAICIFIKNTEAFCEEDDIGIGESIKNFRDLSPLIEIVGKYKGDDEGTLKFIALKNIERMLIITELIDKWIFPILPISFLHSVALYQIFSTIGTNEWDTVSVLALAYVAWIKIFY